MTTTTVPQDARHVPLSQADKLAQDAVEASRIRKLSTHPDVIALRVEKVRTQVDRLMWTGLLLGLAFTMVNVQTFAAAGAAVWSLPWCAAWLLDPMVSLVLVAVLRAEQITARYQVRMRTETLGPWVARTKLFAFLATYVMNTWQSWSLLHISGIVLHSVPPVMVYLAAETGPILRDRLTEAVLKAARAIAPGVVTEAGRPTSAGDGTDLVGDGSPAGAPSTRDGTPTPAENVTGRGASATRKRPARQSRKPRRTSREEYLNLARAAHQPGIAVTPAWVRQAVPGISRGTSQVVSDALKAELAAAHTATITPDQTQTVDPQGRAA
jgi:hypothetical protein